MTADTDPSGPARADGSGHPVQGGGGESPARMGGGLGSVRAANPLRWLASAFLGSKLRIAALALVGIVLLVGLGFVLGVFGVPEVAGIDNTFGAVSANETVVETELRVSNPNPIGVSLGSVTVDYAIDMNDVELATGTKRGLSIGRGVSTIHLESSLNNSAIPAWWTSHVAAGERTDVRVDARVTESTLDRGTTLGHSDTIETDLLGQFDSTEPRPIEANHVLVDDPVLWVNETSAEWGTVTDSETPLDMSFLLYNPNLEPYVLTELRYDVSMNGVALGSGATQDPVVIPGGGTATLDARTVLHNQRLDDWWVTHLNESVHGHQVSQFRIEFEAVIELPTGDRITVPLDQLTHEQFVGTDIFGEGGDVGVPPDERDDGSGASDGGDDGSTDGGGDADGGTTDADGTDGGTDDGGTDDGTSDDGSGGDGSGGDGSGGDSDGSGSDDDGVADGLL